MNSDATIASIALASERVSERALANAARASSERSSSERASERTKRTRSKCDTFVVVSVRKRKYSLEVDFGHKRKAEVSPGKIGGETNLLRGSALKIGFQPKRNLFALQCLQLAIGI